MGARPPVQPGPCLFVHLLAAPVHLYTYWAPVHLEARCLAGAAAGPSRARLDKQNNIQYTCGSAGRPGPSDAAAGALAPRGSGGGGGGGRTSDLKGFSVMLRLAEGLRRPWVRWLQAPQERRPLVDPRPLRPGGEGASSGASPRACWRPDARRRAAVPRRLAGSHH